MFFYCRFFEVTWHSVEGTEPGGVNRTEVRPTALRSDVTYIRQGSVQLL
jgi:hypothetical protein